MKDNMMPNGNELERTHELGPVANRTLHALLVLWTCNEDFFPTVKVGLLHESVDS